MPAPRPANASSSLSRPSETSHGTSHRREPTLTLDEPVPRLYNQHPEKKARIDREGLSDTVDVSRSNVGSSSASTPRPPNKFPKKIASVSRPGFSPAATPSAAPSHVGGSKSGGSSEFTPRAPGRFPNKVASASKPMSSPAPTSSAARSRVDDNEENILCGVVFVISGLKNPERGKLRDMGTSRGLDTDLMRVSRRILAIAHPIRRVLICGGTPPLPRSFSQHPKWAPPTCKIGNPQSVPTYYARSMILPKCEPYEVDTPHPYHVLAHPFSVPTLSVPPLIASKSGIIVRTDWIEACKAARRRLPESRYGFGGSESDGDATEVDSDGTDVDEDGDGAGSPPTRKPVPQLESGTTRSTERADERWTDPAAVLAELPRLPVFFEGVCAAFDDTVLADVRVTLERYIIAYGG
ncbi:hypothetical protein BDK51DRAFT_39473 [Blyttiomyces helicus]|uniref:BRCT domain-containing protein n=1 Tax=Blyttiomyces helicus TaxID=388810 RepID=A0A4P9WJC6_9FUNG|nr:hypothetical protein BDK51DRAFT_39473 [Blyttiomyces helicus]|eukprot:RKO91240.1 hypothetical protein BDK51DRAFT_39473 [Blyttiomyces helicus]